MQMPSVSESQKIILSGIIVHSTDEPRRECNNDYLTEQLRAIEKREAFKHDALSVWQKFQEDGLHVTFEEADAWLAKLEAGIDAEQPQCHA